MGKQDPHHHDGGGTALPQHHLHAHPGSAPRRGLPGGNAVAPQWGAARPHRSVTAALALLAGLLASIWIFNMLHQVRRTAAPVFAVDAFIAALGRTLTRNMPRHTHAAVQRCPIIRLPLHPSCRASSTPSLSARCSTPTTTLPPGPALVGCARAGRQR